MKLSKMVKRSKHLQTIREHEDSEASRNPNKKYDYLKSVVLCLAFSIFAGYQHMSHVEQLFENDKHFSHLSTLERELSFRTENGLYYYYFKILADPDGPEFSFFDAIRNKIINDNRTEYPRTINTLGRFNLYPEVVLAFFYRSMRSCGWLEKTCWTVEREEADAVLSCEGYLEPIYFYSKGVFVLHGFFVFMLFIFCWVLNRRSILSGIIGVLCYFYNHGEATRVMWNPALRENFSFPFHLLQVASLTYMLNQVKTTRPAWMYFTASTLLYLLPWQFAQFSLATQVASLYAMFALGFIRRQKLIEVISAQTCALGICFVMMFANSMLVTSLFASLLFAIWGILLVEMTCLDENKVQATSLLKKIILTIFRVLELVALAIFYKKFLLEWIFKPEDDSHIWDILRSKFNESWHTFDTRLYTCAAEFDFIDIATIYKLTETGLLPLALINFVFIAFKMIGKYFSVEATKDSEKPDELATSQHGVLGYHILQLIAYGIIAALIMRLKLLWTPYLCAVASLIGNKTETFNLIRQVLQRFKINTLGRHSRTIILVAIISLMSYNGVKNLNKQYSIMGEYSQYSQERLMNWINENTHENDAFIASMPLSANIKLSTDRPIAIHPHYEDVDLRARVKAHYSQLYGFRPVSELYAILKYEYKVKYLVTEKHFCMASPPGKPHCAPKSIAHIGMERVTSQQACALIITQTGGAEKYFKKAFESNGISVFRIL